MFSIPHMIVIFVIVLVVFGPQKLPELARSLGKLMAEFRKASSDFRGAFEEEMKDLERQAREVERKKAADAAAKAAEAEPVQVATLATVAGTETPERAAAEDAAAAASSSAVVASSAGPVMAADGEVAFAGATTQAVFADVDDNAFGNLIDARVTEGSKELVATPVAEAVARGSREDIDVVSEVHTSGAAEAAAPFVAPEVSAGGVESKAAEVGVEKSNLPNSSTDQLDLPS
jgi:TatA/E family protein of Tat protein translocase